MNPETVRLDPEEQEIESSFDSLEPMSESEKLKLASTFKSAAWKKPVTMRLSAEVIAELKRRAKLDGIPYQTLASMILQKYVRGALLDKDAVKEVVKALA